MVCADSGNQQVQVGQFVAIHHTKLFETKRAKQCLEGIRVGEVDACDHAWVELTDSQVGRVCMLQAWTRVDEVLPSACGSSTTEEC